MGLLSCSSDSRASTIQSHLLEPSNISVLPESPSRPLENLFCLFKSPAMRRRSDSHQLLLDFPMCRLVFALIIECFRANQPSLIRTTRCWSSWVTYHSLYSASSRVISSPSRKKHAISTIPAIGDFWTRMTILAFAISKSAWSSNRRSSITASLHTVQYSTS